MEINKLEKYLNIKDCVLLSINRNEHLILSEEIAKDESGKLTRTHSFMLVHIKLEESGLKCIFAKNLGSFTYNKDVTINDFKLYDTFPYREELQYFASMNSIVLIKTPSRVYMYDTFLRRIVHKNIDFIDMFTSSKDLVRGNETEVNLIRDETEEDFLQRKGIYLLSFRTDARDYLYPAFNSEGRLVSLFRCLEEVTNSSVDLGLSVGKVFEDSITGDEEKLKYICSTIDSNRGDYIEEHKSAVLLSMIRK